MSDQSNGYVTLNNFHHNKGNADYFLHFSLNTEKDDIPKIFGGVQFVCVGGSQSRMLKLINYFGKELHFENETPTANLAKDTDRFVMYRYGPILCVSHGMGVGSISIMLHELIKILYHAGCKDVYCFRVGTSGAIGLEPGTVIISEKVVNSTCEPEFKVDILGKTVSRPATLDVKLHEELKNLISNCDEFAVVSGTTMCTNDFYEGQARLDGAFCSYTEEEKMSYLRKINQLGVTNIEMESTCFASMCHRANIRAGIVCVALINRLKSDQNCVSKETLTMWELRPFMIVARFIKDKLQI